MRSFTEDCVPPGRIGFLPAMTGGVLYIEEYAFFRILNVIVWLDINNLFIVTSDITTSTSYLFEPEGPSNYYGIDDDELYNLAEDMIRTEPGDLLAYCEKWVDFQERFIELEPVIPIYSNIYFDFYPRVLQNYAIPNYTSWAQAVVPAFMDDIPEEEEAAEEEEDVFND